MSAQNYQLTRKTIVISGASSGADRAMVVAAKKPAANTYVGSASYLLKFAHTLAPELVTKSTAFVMRRYLKTRNQLNQPVVICTI
jgi:short-subunit dehydrogenase